MCSAFVNKQILRCLRARNANKVSQLTRVPLALPTTAMTVVNAAGDAQGMASIKLCADQRGFQAQLRLSKLHSALCDAAVA